MVNVNVLRGCEVYVTTKLAYVLSRVNMIYNCLPEDLHFYMDNVKSNVVTVLKNFDCDININDVEGLTFLDKVTLYTELSSIYNDLNECILLTFYNNDLQFAFNNIYYIMEKMAEYDSVFKWCYDNNVKKRVLNNI